MKSNQQERENLNRISLNHICSNIQDPKLYYFKKLNVFIFEYEIFHTIDYGKKQITVLALEKGVDNQLHFQENRLTKQMQKKIDYEWDDIGDCNVFEESEEIIIQQFYYVKICTFKQLQNELKTKVRCFDDKRLLQFQLFGKYYIGIFDNQVYIIRQNNLKIVLRQIIEDPEAQTQSFHLLQIERDDELLFYKRSSFKLKIIRKYRNQSSKQELFYQGRYIAIQENQQLRIIDSTNMRLKQQNKLLSDYFIIEPIRELGIFLIPYRSMNHLINQNSMELQDSSLIQTIIVGGQLKFIKYTQNLGLIILYNQN